MVPGNNLTIVVLYTQLTIYSLLMTYSVLTIIFILCNNINLLAIVRIDVIQCMKCLIVQYL